MIDRYKTLIDDIKETDLNGLDAKSTKHIYQQLQRISNRISLSEESRQIAADAVKSLARLDWFEHEISKTSKDQKPPKRTIDNIAQFFEDTPTEEPIWLSTLEDERIKFKLDYDIDTEKITGTKKNIKKFIEEKRQEYLKRITDHLTNSGITHAFTPSTFEDNVTQLIKQINRKAEKKSIPAATKLNKLLTEFRYCKFHGLEGQGRLDASDIQKAINTLRPQVTKEQEPNQDTRIRSLIDAIQEGKKEMPPEVYKDEDFYAFKYFETQKMLQDANPQHMPKLVIANYHDTEDFLQAFYLAIQAGSITINGDIVTEAQVAILPLLESVKDHDDGPENIKRLLSIPIIRSYFTKLGIFNYMKAYSDTSRENGLSETLRSLCLDPTKLLEIARKASAIQALLDKGGVTEDINADELKSDPHGLFSANEATITAYNKLYAKDIEVEGTEPFEVTHQDGIGAAFARGGGPGFDALWKHMLGSKEQIKANRTLQPGELEQKLQPDTVATYLDQLIQDFQPNPVSKKLQETLDDTKFSDWMKEFTAPSKKAWEECKPGFIDKNRAISVSAACRQLGISPHTITPFHAIIETYLTSNKDLSKLIDLFKNNSYFKLFILKHYEGLLNSDIETLEIMTQGDLQSKKSCEYYKEKIDQAKRWCEAIIGDQSEIENEPGLNWKDTLDKVKENAKIDNEQRRKIARIMKELEKKFVTRHKYEDCLTDASKPAHWLNLQNNSPFLWVLKNKLHVGSRSKPAPTLGEDLYEIDKESPYLQLYIELCKYPTRYG